MPDNIFIILVLTILFYLIGSVPTAFLVIKFFHKKDITKEGSGNVGAMNSYDVSGSKKTGIFVFVIDFLKGLIPALIILVFLKIDFEIILLPLIALVTGHNFSVWIRFKGGRGLATAAGILIILNYWTVIIWCVLYLVSNLIKKNVHIGNSVATILLPFVLLLMNSQGFSSSQYSEIPNEIFNIFCSVLCLLILLKHISPILSIIRKSK
ncbi:MAG: glycerol-3-phosphate acyltransferase [Ignavibacteria bacterium]|jgi:glycerol-3-phosphate acyltransferase PlsY